jgi:hypothetical protein
MNLQLPDRLIEDIQNVMIDQHEPELKEILVTMDTKPLQIVMNQLMTVAVKDFIKEELLSIKTGFPQQDGTFALFKSTHEKLVKITESEITSKILPEQTPIYLMSKKLLLGLLSFFIEMKQE